MSGLGLGARQLTPAGSLDTALRSSATRWPSTPSGPASAEELQRTACAVMAFGFAEVTTVDQVLGRIPAAATA